jgi:TRAP-type uncharacterized transport system substrate-binding protein
MDFSKHTFAAAAAVGLTLLAASTPLKIPLHSAAKRYWKEAGYLD